MTVQRAVTETLGDGGVLARRLPGFRHRPQQVRMAEHVGGALDEGRHLLVEAPTGVGKSLAYLVPAILGPVAEGRRVVVSTQTIALQEQLLEKDLPLLDACLPVEFAAVKAMGRLNYVSLRRLDEAVDNAPRLVADDRETRSLQRVRDWSREAAEGTRQELGHAPAAVWDLVRSEADNCLGRRCPTYEQCFFQTARRRLQNADVIVTNHALYFSDLRLRMEGAGVLPDHDALVLDEAHHVMGVAAEHFGDHVSRIGLLRLLRRLDSRRGVGLLHRIGGSGSARLREAVARLRTLVQAFFHEVGAFADAHPAASGRVREPGFVDDLLSGPLDGLADRLEVDLSPRSEGEEQELQAMILRSRAGAATVRRLLAVDDPEMVYFVEREGHDVGLVARPLDVAPLLAEHLFDGRRPVVLTSATLAVSPGEEGLSYSAERLGCPEADRLLLDSPFDFDRQVELHLPRGLPLPDEEGFVRSAADAVARYVERVDGGAFVLFTSYASLTAVHALLEPRFRGEGRLVLRQGGSLDRKRMLAAFREDGHAVLFGADSFWEGVDVAGPALRLVVIMRLPFPVPTLPLNAARAERLRRAGRSPFAEFLLPEALLRFRQGFGRLVRTEEDEGLVVCLDGRILVRPYGRRFLAALPSCRIVTPGRGQGAARDGFLGAGSEPA